MDPRPKHCVETSDVTASLDGQIWPGVGAEALRPGTRFGRYTVIERLGAGGMGVVYAAYDSHLDRKIALKILRPARGRQPRDTPETRALLLREAQALAKLSHPNVVTVHDVGEIGGQVFMTLEFLRGATLKEWLGGARRKWREIVEVFRQAGEGLAAAHAAGLVHRDFKPTNVFVGDDGRVRVVDFGLARRTPQSAEPAGGETSEPPSPGDPPNLLESPMTRTGAVVGTPAYLAPEQLRGERADERTDQFAFCLTLYEALWRESPFPDASAGERSSAVLAGQRREPPSLPAVPGWLRRAVLRGLETDPPSRHPSMRALLQIFERRMASRRLRRMAVVAVAVAALALALWWQLDRSALCGGGAARLAEQWNPRLRSELATAFTATGKPYAEAARQSVEARFDAFAGAWLEMYRDACAATHFRGEQSPELLDLRMACLDRRLKTLGALAARLAEADAAVVERAVEAAEDLGGLERCADTELLTGRVPPPDDDDGRAAVEAVETELAGIEALSLTGAWEAGLDAAGGAVERAREIGYGPLLAEALLLRGRLYDDLGRFDEARQDFHEALLAAQEAGDDARVVETGLWLARTIGYQQSHPDEARPWERLAAATLGRLDGERPSLEAFLASSRLMLFTQEGDYEKALEEARSALAWIETAGEAESLDAAQLHNNAGVALNHLGRYDEARAAYERSLELYRRRVGPRHPLVADLIFNLSNLHWTRGDYDLALEEAREALDIRLVSLPEDHPDLAGSYASVAQPLQNLGRLAEAREYQLKALAIQEKTLGPEHIYVAASLNNLAFNEREQGRFDDAVASYRRALAIFESNLGPDHPYVAFALTGLGETWLRSGHSDQAREPLERALAIRRRHAVAPKDLAGSAFALARALWQSGDDRRRALELATEASALYGQAGEGHAARRGEVDAWLDEHR